MKKRITLIIAMLIILCLKSEAEEHSLPRFTFGAEWGYIGSLYSGYHHNFYAPEGYRVDTRGHSLGYNNNAEGYIHAGYNLDPRTNLSLYIGMSGILDYHLTAPISFRLTRFYNDNHLSDRYFTFIDLGSGISIKKNPQEIFSLKIGGGYRVSLSRDTKLDFMIAYRSIFTHPDIDYYGTPISRNRINRNNAYVSALSVSMSLTF